MPELERKITARPEFSIEAVQNKSKSEEEGRPIFDQREVVKIITPGQRDNCVLLADEIIVGTRPPMSAKELWPDHYAAFKRGEMRAVTGTPLEHWPPLTKARVAELKAAGLFSVEEYAEVPDNIIGKLGMGARGERDQARAFIDSAKGSAQVTAMAAKIEQLQAMVEQLSGGKPPPKPEKKKAA